MREDDIRLKGLETCEFLVHLVFAFGMDYFNNLKGKDLRFLTLYHFGSEKLKVSPNKVELGEAVTGFF